MSASGNEPTRIRRHIRAPVRPADNETGWRMALSKLAALVEKG